MRDRDPNDRRGPREHPIRLDRGYGAEWLDANEWGSVAPPGKRTLSEAQSLPLLRATRGDAGGDAAIDATRAEVETSRGEPLPAPLVDALDRAWGHDLGGARIHRGPEAARAARSVDARAFTIGNDIYLGEGEGAPGTPSGNTLLAHEAAHVVQHQRGRIAADGAHAKRVSDPGDPLEHEADALAARAAPFLDGIAFTPDAAPPSSRTSSAPPGGAPRILRAPILRWARGADGRLTEQARNEIEARLESQIHIRGAEIGDLEPIAGWTDERIDRAIDHVTRLGRIGGGRVTRAWHQHLDDLGLGGRGRYRNILMFMDELDRLSGGDWFAMRSDMPRVRLAGGPAMAVHWRAVYFAAAAQVGMDERGRDAPGRTGTAGQGHYIPVGGFHRLLTEMRDMLHRLATESQGRGRGPRRTPVDGGAAILATIQGEIARMMTVLQAQEEQRNVPGYNWDEHIEPALRQYLLSRRAAIEAIATPASDAHVPAAAQALLTALGDLHLSGAHGDRAHRHSDSVWAVDPHGTEHAMGIAIDIYSGSDPTNYGVREAYWPFIHLLIQSHGAEVGLSTERPTSTTTTPPSVLRKISRLLELRGRALRAELRETEPTDGARANAADRRHLGSLGAVRSSARTALQNRLAALQRAAAAPTLDAASRDRVRFEIDDLTRDLGALGDMDPAELRATLARHQTVLAALDRPGGPESGRDPLGDVGPTDGGVSIPRVIEELDRIPDAAAAEQAMARVNRRDARASLADPRFESWLQAVTDGHHPLFDQPDAMVEGINSVHAHADRRGRTSEASTFYGTHHWDVLPHAALQNVDEYRHSLERDLAPRAPAQIERILSIMAESDGGRQILFGPRDPTFHDVVAARLGGAGAEQAMLDRIRARVVTPYEGGRGEGAALRRELRDHGFYLPNPTTP